MAEARWVHSQTFPARGERMLLELPGPVDIGRLQSVKKSRSADAAEGVLHSAVWLLVCLCVCVMAGLSCGGPFSAKKCPVVKRHNNCFLTARQVSQNAAQRQRLERTDPSPIRNRPYLQGAMLDITTPSEQRDRIARIWFRIWFRAEGLMDMKLTVLALTSGGLGGCDLDVRPRPFLRTNRILSALLQEGP